MNDDVYLQRRLDRAIEDMDRTIAKCMKVWRSIEFTLEEKRERIKAITGACIRRLDE